VVGDVNATIDGCSYLFLSEIQELDFNGLRVVVCEGRPTGEAEPRFVGDSVIPDCTRIEITEDSAAFEIIWENYVAYSVLNESYAAPDGEEQYEGRRFRVYSKSRFIDYVARASFACPEYPGPSQHYGIVCENHVIDVISTVPPIVLP
jgi:hypothetical protein